MELEKYTREYLKSFRAQLEDKGLKPDPINGTHELINSNTCKDIIPHPDFNPSPNNTSCFKLGEIWFFSD